MTNVSSVFMILIKIIKVMEIMYLLRRLNAVLDQKTNLTAHQERLKLALASIMVFG